MVHVTTLTLGLWPRQGHGKVQAKNPKPQKSHSHSQDCKGMNPHIPKWTPTLEVGISMHSWIFKNNLKGQNSLDWRVIYTIENLLKHRCLKWVFMKYLNAYNTSYIEKKDRESKCQFDFRPVKVRNCPELHACRWLATYCWKYFDKGYNFASIKSLHKKLWTSKVMGVLILGISRLLTWKSRKEWHLGVAPVANHREYSKGGKWWFPQIQGMMSLVSPCMFVVHLCIILQLWTNQLVVWFVQVHMNNWPTCHPS
jgi:hypothetical protein